MISKEEIIARLDEIENPYPVDIFSEIGNDDLKKIDDLLKRELGFGIDRLSGHIGRFVFKETIKRVKGEITDLYGGEGEKKTYKEKS